MMSMKQLNGMNFKELLTCELGNPLSRFSESPSVRSFPDYVRKAIKVRAKTSGAVLQIVAYDQRGDAIYFQDLFIPPNGSRLVVVRRGTE
jgi:GntR family transcriptional regulator